MQLLQILAGIFQAFWEASALIYQYLLNPKNNGIS